MLNKYIGNNEMKIKKDMRFFNSQMKNLFYSQVPRKTSPVNMYKIILTSLVGSLILILGAFLYFNYGYLVINLFYDLQIKIIELIQ